MVEAAQSEREEGRHREDAERAEDARWCLLLTLPSQVEASLLEGLLREHGLRCVVESVFFSQEPLSFGALGNFRLHVLKEDMQAARRLVEAAQRSTGSSEAELV